jgi:signal transduction histidine kinase
VSGGNGLIGMRERALVFGGTLEAGPRSGGGWQVRATLPFGNT